MAADLSAELVASYLAAAHAAATSRNWGEVRDLVEDVLVLDHTNTDALTLRKLAERHIGQGDPDWGRRHETVLFADLVASTALANRFDPEVVRRLTRDYELACTPAITALGGHVHRFVGDGIVASFGYPTSHEDDARRAVQAALDLVEAVAATSAAHQDVGVALEVRVGVASGILVHADRGVGSWTQAGDLFGPAVNLAARLHEVAAPGQVCISDETAGLVSGYFELESLGGHELKGFDAPVVAHRVVRQTEATGWVDRFGTEVSPFVNRSRESELLRSHWQRVAIDADGDPAQSVSIFVSGDPGVGKTRQVREFVASTASIERNVVDLRCSAFHSTSPLHPVRAAIERHCGLTPDDDDRTRLAKLVATLEGSSVTLTDAVPYIALLLDIDLDDQLERPQLSPAQLREVTLRHLHDWILGVAASRPTILVVEDLHWADPSTRELLRHVATSRHEGLFTIATSRAAPAWALEAGFEHLALAPLSQDETRTLAAAVLDTELPPRVIDEIARRSDGIPLFVEQLADSVSRDDERILGHGGGAIPSKLAELLQARLDSTGSSKRVAQLAATVGREFEPDLIAAVASLLQREGRLETFDRSVPDHLDRLVVSKLVEADPHDPHLLRFHHALVADAAYESQLLEERPERHEAVARLLLARAADGGRAPDPAVVAHHFERADRPAEAIVQYLDAAVRGQAAGAFAEVTANLGRAEALLSQLEDGSRHAFELAIRLNRGLAISSAAGYAAQGVIDDFARAVELCDVLRDDRDVADDVMKALLGLWTYYCATGNLTTAAAISTSMEQQLQRVRMPGVRPSFHACRGVEHFFGGALEAAEQHLGRAAELFATDDVDLSVWPLPNDPLAAALAFLAPLRYARGDVGGALAAPGPAVARCQQIAFPVGPFSLAFVREYEAWFHRLRGDNAGARAAAEEVVQIGEQHGFFDWIVTGRIHLTAALVAEQPSLATLSEMREAIELWTAVGGRVGLPALLVEQGFGYLALGDVENTARCIDEAVSLAGADQRFGYSELHRLRAELALATAGITDPAVEAELLAGMRLAQEQAAPLFLVRCGDSYERIFGAGRLDAELRQALEAGRAMFATAESAPSQVPAS
jgi:class 3 adenylate cyclase